MTINKYLFDENKKKNYLKLIEKLYPSSYAKTRYMNVEYLLNKKNPFFRYASVQNFLIEENGLPLGHISAIIDPRLKKHGKQIGLVGFFEAVNDETAYTLLESAAKWLSKNNANIIRGPVDLTIWHGYRFAENGSTSGHFLSEPLNLSTYPIYFHNFGFQKVLEARSSKAGFVRIADWGIRQLYNRAIKKGYTFRPVNINRFEKEISVFYNIAKTVFRPSWTITPITFEEFLYLYYPLKTHVDPQLVIFLSDPSGKEVGFFMTYPNPYNRTQLILKNIALLPQYQGVRLGMAMASYVHQQAVRKNYKETIYPLIRRGTRPEKMLAPWKRTFRTYAAYELK